MIKKIARWILTRVDLTVRLDDQILNIKVSMAGTTLIEWTIPLIKDELTAGVKHGTKAWKA